MIQRKFPVWFTDRNTFREFDELRQECVSQMNHQTGHLQSLALAAALNSSATALGGHSMQPSIAEL